MELPSVFVFTHDSIGVGEDGPTHQPVEHLASLRAIPGLDTFRPADANEVREAWKHALAQKRHPSALVLSRQALPTLDREIYAPANGLERGAYVLAASDDPQIVLMATGSEVSLAAQAHERLTAAGVRSQLVSMPCWSLFERQDEAYRATVLPPSCTARLAIEMAGPFGWDRYVGPQGRTITMGHFGASGPIGGLQEKFGFTLGNVISVAEAMLEEGK